jgi:hypothetical protein
MTTQIMLMCVNFLTNKKVEQKLQTHIHGSDAHSVNTLHHTLSFSEELVDLGLLLEEPDDRGDLLLVMDEVKSFAELP